MWWDNESLVKQAASLLGKQTDIKSYVYISVGGQEDKVMQKDAKDIFKILQKANKPSFKVDFWELPNENHATILHQSINDAFKKLFPFKE